MNATRNASKNRAKGNGAKGNTTRRRLGRRTFINVLNDDFKEMMRHRGDPSKHLFFQSIRWFKSMYAMWSAESWALKAKDSAIPYNPTVDLTALTPLSDCRFVPTKTLTPAYLNAFYEQLTTTQDYSAIRTKCHDMTNYALPSTVDSLAKWKRFADPSAINVVILGAGPVGLYTALYLQHIYNKDIENMTEFSFRKVNILLVDNRIHKEGEKMPYSRSTQFGFSIEEIQPFLQQIFCWDMVKYDVRAFDYIHVLENLLYTVAYKTQIPMAFTKQLEDPVALKAFVAKESIHVLFDCTGGRSRIPVAHGVRWNDYSFKEGAGEVKLNPDTQTYEYCEGGKAFTTQVLRLQLFDKDRNEFLIGNEFAEPTDPADMELATKYNNQCFRTKDFLHVASAFQKEKIRHLFPHMLEVGGLKEKDVDSVKIAVFNTVARHSPFAAASFERGCVLIRIGDSLAGTEYGIVFGMKHSIEFSKHICNLMSTFI